MPERTAPATAHSVPEPPPIPDGDRPDLPPELLPLHEEYGRWWVITYHPLCRKIPYAARPRRCDGPQPPSSVRADTISMLARVLAAATPDEDSDAEDGTPLRSARVR